MYASANLQNEKSDWALVAIGMLNLWLGRPYVDAVLVKLSLLSKETIEKFAIGSFVYSVLLFIEGVGLCLRKRWAEILTVGITGSLLPFEFYELYQHVTVPRAVVTILNLAILVYLIVQLVNDRRRTAQC